MAGYRRNSVILDFHAMPVRPKAEQVKDFLLKKMKIDMGKTKNIQFCISKSQVIIEVESAALAEELIEQHNEQHSVEHDNKQYKIPVRSIDNAIEVKVHDLAPHMPNRLIAKQLSQYGEVLSVKDDTWKEFFPGMPNGVRSVRIVLKKPIPSYVIVENDTAYVKYQNQIRTCRHCVRALHVGKSCVEARKELDGDNNNRLTAAQVVQGLAPSDVLPGPSGTTPPPPASSLIPSSPPKPSDSSESDSEDEPLLPKYSKKPTLRSSSLARNNATQPTGSGSDDLELGQKRPASPNLGDNEKKSRSRSKNK